MAHRQVFNSHPQTPRNLRTLWGEEDAVYTSLIQKTRAWFMTFGPLILRC